MSTYFLLFPDKSFITFNLKPSLHDLVDNFLFYSFPGDRVVFEKFFNNDLKKVCSLTSSDNKTVYCTWYEPFTPENF